MNTYFSNPITYYLDIQFADHQQIDCQERADNPFTKA